MAPTIGRVALDNGFHGSIPGDWVAPPPQNIQLRSLSGFQEEADDFFCIGADRGCPGLEIIFRVGKILPMVLRK